VFFEDGGIAFHSGSPNRSSGGCIHLEPVDAEAWFNYLQIGDQVQVEGRRGAGRAQAERRAAAHHDGRARAREARAVRRPVRTRRRREQRR